jgi:hypothetical protein
MKVEDYYPAGKRWWVRLHEKGGKRHEMPAHHKLEHFIDEYLAAAEMGRSGVDCRGGGDRRGRQQARVAHRHCHRARGGWRSDRRRRARRRKKASSAKPRTSPPGCQALAEPGTILIADDTRRLIGGLFELIDLCPQ